MADEQGNVYAPTEARVDDVVVAGEIDRATRGTRLGATLLDVVMLMGVVMLGGIFAAVAIPAMSKGNSESGVLVSIIVIGLVGIAALGLLIANIYYLHKNGQTVGKKILGIKVVRTNGERAGLARIFFLRYLPVTLMGAVPYIGFLVALTDSLLIFRESQQCLHDNIADTIVIKA